MDVSRKSFQWQLPRILRALANTHFVSMDLELSGIQSKPKRKSRTTGDINGKQSLQQRYEEAKEAAEKYQVLQVGLTCVSEDQENAKYVARPYNFFLNPVLEGKFNVERIFSYQSGAVEFLLNHGFRMDAPFLEGVSYLSREEEGWARGSELSHMDRAAFADMEVKSGDVESLQFLQRVRGEIEVWKSRTTSYPEFLNIAPIGFTSIGSVERGLNNYQKRLVHQIVRAEHPDLVTISKTGFIQIEARDEKRENDFKKAKMKAFEERIAKQTGFRWIVEALVGGDLSTVDPRTFNKTPENEPFWIDLNEVVREFHELRRRLSNKRMVLVGHNIFIDLVNFYKCFFGPLPDKVEDFQSVMHQLFPMIIDTKYLATHNSVALNARSGLEELDEELSKLTEPVIETHHEHPKYISATPSHEAGYDSYLTAKVLIRLSAQLEAAGHYIDVPVGDEDDHTMPEERKSLSENTKVSLASVRTQDKCDSTRHRATDNDASLQKKTTNGTNLGALSSRLYKPVKKISKSNQQPYQPYKKTPFSHSTIFDILVTTEYDDEEEPGSEAETPVLASTTPAVVISHVDSVPRPRLMPPWESDFWNVYGNKLRVNGTLEGVCILKREA